MSYIVYLSIIISLGPAEILYARPVSEEILALNSYLFISKSQSLRAIGNLSIEFGGQLTTAFSDWQRERRVVSQCQIFFTGQSGKKYLSGHKRA